MRSTPSLSAFCSTWATTGRPSTVVTNPRMLRGFWVGIEIMSSTPLVVTSGMGKATSTVTSALEVLAKR